VNVSSVQHRDDIPAGLPKHEFLAGHIALDFCNSMSPMLREGPPDRIADPVDFVGWAARAGFEVDRSPSPTALASFHRLRAALCRIFVALVDAGDARPADLALLNAELAKARAAERLVAGSDGYAVEDGAPDSVDRLRHAIVRDAAALVTGERRRLKRCPAHDCQWLFYDGSKNLSRRWCAMDDCGTLEKVRRYRGRRG
jgi:predicted RNA-binding Zn ribbon-like protein